MDTIHPSAIIHRDALLGMDVRVGSRTIIEHGVTIGDGSVIGNNVRLSTGTSLGKRCRIGDWAVIGTPPQSVSFDTSEKTFVEIGDEVEIAEFVTVHRATTESFTTRIGPFCRLLRYSHVGHDGQLQDHVLLEDFVQLGGHTHIGRYTRLRSNFPVHQFSHIGSYCDVAHTVRKDIPPFVRYGSVEELILDINTPVLHETGIPEEEISAISHAYEILFWSGINISQGLERIPQEMEITPAVAEIIEFISTSKRGIPRRARK